MARRKFYVVWKGQNPGIYDTWEECKFQVEGQNDAKYKSYDSLEEARKAFEEGYKANINFSKKDPQHKIFSTSSPIIQSLSVDAACSGNPGDMEYRGVHTATGKEIFKVGPLKKGTNNVGEFLALVHGLAFLKQRESNLPIYSDSRNAIIWVKNKKCKTLLERVPENEEIFDMIERAEKWLKTNQYTNPIYKWETKQWGEIPADFGRK